MRLAYYAGASTAAAAACLLKAFHQRPNFYSATVYLSQSNACLLILTNLLLLLSCSFIYGLQRLLYGPLRPIEIEQLSEKAWYAVLDTLLAMPSFREDVGGWLLTMFVLLMAGKVWSWIGEGRVDILEQQPPANPRLFHVRLASSLIMSVAFDLYMLNYCVETVMADPRPGMMVIFTFEFAVLSVFTIFTFSRYILSVVEISIQKRQLKDAIEARKNELRAERAASQEEGQTVPETPVEVDENEVDVPGWEEKRRYLFALEVINDFVKLMIYVVFFTVSITFNGLPMHIMRDVYMTFASFSKRVTDYIAYRKATSDMNTRYPDATTEEIREDACIVCRENMSAWELPVAEGNQAAVVAARRDPGLRAKKLPCGHILHLRCLKAWLERQQVCPTCRRPVVVPNTEIQPTAPVQGGNPAAPERRQQQNRARIFNLGPVRIGFLNGQGDQIQNVLQQMRDQARPPAAAPQPGPVLDPGLQVPNLPQTLQPAGGQQPSISTTSTTSTQIQMMQLEQRLMQDALNLAIDQRQLHVLRCMEMELARLRALQIPSQPAIGTTSSTQRQLASLGQIGPTEELRGNPSQALQSGDQTLPAGLVLPEGWSILPLSRTAPRNGPTIAHTTSIGPTDEHGSPYFVPTVAPNTQSLQMNGHSTIPSTQNAPSTVHTRDGGTAETSENHTRPAQPTPQSLPKTTSQEQAKASPAPTAPQGNGIPGPWGSNGWSFERPSKEEDSSSAGTSTEDSPDEEAPYPGKGKGRAVEVEDVSDSE